MIHVIGLWVVAVWVAVITINMVIEERRHPDEKPFAPHMVDSRRGDRGGLSGHLCRDRSRWTGGDVMSREQPVSQRVHFQTEYPNRAYCGAVSPGRITRDRNLTTCPNCGAALRADEAARS